MNPLKKIKDWIARGKAGWHLSGGRSSLKQGKYKEALKEFRKALKASPNDPEILHYNAMTLLKLKRPEKALKCYEKILKNNPKLAEAWNNKGVVLKELKRYDEALECYERALQIDPQDDGTWNNKGALLDTIGKPKGTTNRSTRRWNMEQQRSAP
ncbi:tetratricopeptide repeat protein [Methanothermobacter tenebrarum]|uniref:tetratricopeptide repeat protein n=1 Tax=Methanothermobacter tenebrarum TaxID=680118 RepID=UPI001FED0685|nr:tetratricopeptide repeat protein [Methanothermobacter tenebrarum]